MAHFGLPAGVDGLEVHAGAGGSEVGGFEVADEEAVGAEEERVVGPAGAAEGVEHVGPDFAVAEFVFVEAIGLDLEGETDTFHVWHDIGCRGGMAMKDERQLKDLAGVGRAFLKDFEMLGIRSVSQLAKKDGKKLYRELCRLTGTRQDPCVEDTLVCAVAQARDPGLPAEQRQWWYWSRVRKAGGR